MMRFLHHAERGLVAAGLVLLGLAGAALAHRELMSRASLRAFDVAAAVAVAPVQDPGDRTGAEPTTVPADDLGVDTSRWAEGRIAKYRASLGLELGTPLAVLSIAKLGLTVPVLAGTGEEALNRGVGHIAGTAAPGEAGNVGIAGHRDGFFRGLQDLVCGDLLELRTRDGVESFQVEAISIVPPTEVSVLDPTDQPTLTLVTCYPFYYVGSAPLRYIVRATLVTGPPASAS